MKYTIKMSKTGLLTFFFLLFAIHAYSQVTIGSSAKPNRGSLLDIKEFDDATALAGGRTANRGLLMPRVALEDNFTLLPISSDDSDQNKAIHTGLVVYNTRQNIIIDEEGCNSNIDVLYSGINVWDGKEWIPIGYTPIDTIAAFPNIKMVKDHEGNRYTSRKFGDAGTWMTQNLITKTFPPNLNLSTQVAPYSTAPRSTQANAVYGYPRKLKDDAITNPVDFNAAPDAGLLYSRAAVYATPGTDPGPKAAATVFSYPHQGICPTGWHVPTQQEWDALILEIQTHRTEYTLYESGETFYSNKALLSACNLFGPTADTKSKPSLQGGFGAYFVGWASIASGLIFNNTVGEFAAMTNNGAGFISMDGVPDGSVRTGYNWADSQMMSLRCKKDTDD